MTNETTTSIEAQIRRLALAYLSANIGDFLEDWPDFFDATEGYPHLRAMSYDELEQTVTRMALEAMASPAS